MAQRSVLVGFRRRWRTLDKSLSEEPLAKETLDAAEQDSLTPGELREQYHQWRREITKSAKSSFPIYPRLVEAILKDRELSSTERCLYFLLLVTVNRDGKTWKTTKELSDLLECSEDTTKHGLRKLEAQGYITRIQHKRPNGRKHIYIRRRPVADGKAGQEAART